MKLWSIITFMFFLNFTALPSIAVLAGWNLPKTNVMINEEEQHSHYSSVSIFEKTLPKTLDIFDYLQFFEPALEGNSFILTDDSHPLSPMLSIFSPPPEI